MLESRETAESTETDAALDTESTREHRRTQRQDRLFFKRGIASSARLRALEAMTFLLCVLRLSVSLCRKKNHPLPLKSRKP